MELEVIRPTKVDLLGFAKTEASIAEPLNLWLLPLFNQTARYKRFETIPPLIKNFIGALESSIETPSCTVYTYENQVIRLVMRKVEVVVLRSFDGGGPGGNSVGPGGAAVVGDHVTRRFKNGGRVGNVWAADAG